ncbi:MAG: RNA polymerase sigma factor [Phycisphaeraceae bacterium]
MTEFPDTQHSLLAKVRSADEQEAWAHFVVLYRPVIYRMARRRGLQDADAQDLTQTVLMRVAGAIDRWEPNAPGVRFRHWLRRVAKNAILNALTRSPRDAAAGGTAAQDLLREQPAASPELEEELRLESMRERYLRAAASVQHDVSPDTWAAFHLSVVEQVPCEEVATTIGKSIGTVYAARSRVIRRLREAVEQLEDIER